MENTWFVTDGHTDNLSPKISQPLT